MTAIQAAHTSGSYLKACAPHLRITPRVIPRVTPASSPVHTPPDPRPLCFSIRRDSDTPPHPSSSRVKHLHTRRIAPPHTLSMRTRGPTIQ